MAKLVNKELKKESYVTIVLQDIKSDQLKDWGEIERNWQERWQEVKASGSSDWPCLVMEEQLREACRQQVASIQRKLKELKEDATAAQVSSAAGALIADACAQDCDDSMHI